MKWPNDIFYDGLCALFDYVTKTLIKPDIEVEVITDLSEEDIEYFMANNIRGFIVDVDETLRFDAEDIPYENEEWLNMAHDKLKIVILSNGRDTKLEDKFSEMNIPYIYRTSLSGKPSKSFFKKALDALELEPQEVVVIGDDLLYDIHGGNRNGMTTIKVSGEKKLIKK